MDKRSVGIQWRFTEKIALTDFIEEHVNVLCVLLDLIDGRIEFRDQLEEQERWLFSILIVAVRLTSEVTMMNLS